MEKKESKISRNAIFAVFMLALAVSIVVAAIYDAVRLRHAEANIQAHFTSVERLREPLDLTTVRVQNLQEDSALSLGNYRGQLLVVNLWATWCRPCVSELPTLQLMQDHFGAEQLRVVAVSVDPNKDLPRVQKFIDIHNLAPLARYHDTYGDVQDALGQGVLPVTYIFAADGTPLYRIKGEGNWMSVDVLAFMDAVY